VPTLKNSEALYQLRIDLADIRPPVWRRVLVPPEYHLGELHTVIQLAMGWWECHLHQFNVRGTIYSRKDFELDDDPPDESGVTVAKAFPRGSGKIGYVYDFGDHWRHVVRCEGKVPRNSVPQVPYCSGGKRSRPPEDVGGPYGYARFLKSISDPTDEEHEEYLEWVGGRFDPEECDRDQVNEELARWEQAGRLYLEDMDEVFSNP
jgi:hypothetical protein